MVELVRPMVSEGKAEEEPGENPNASQLVGGLVSNWNRDFSATLNFVPVTPSLVPDLRSLNSTLFPMTYNERYYKEVLAIDSLSRIGIPVSIGASGNDSIICSILGQQGGGHVFLPIASFPC